MSRLFSRRSREGYLEIDHRDSPGITREEAAIASRLACVPVVPVGRGQVLQAPTINCHCCEALVVVNPKRDRERGYCPIHDDYACDLCHAQRIQTGKCVPFAKIIDDFIDAAAKGKLCLPPGY